MITQQSIQQFVGFQPVPTQSVFRDLIANPSPSTQRFLREVAPEQIVKYARSGGLQVGSDWRSDLSTVSIEDLFLVVKAEEHKRDRTLGVRLLRPLRPLRPLVNMPIGFILDIDLNSLSVEQQDEAIDGMCLASLYLSFGV